MYKSESSNICKLADIPLCTLRTRRRRNLEGTSKLSRREAGCFGSRSKGGRRRAPTLSPGIGFAEALFDLILYREQNGTADLGIGLPRGFSTYLNLSQRVGWFKRSVPFRFYWVDQSETVEED